MIQNKKRIISLILMLTLLVSALVVGTVTASAADQETVKYTISSYPAGTQYKAETHKLDDYLTVITNTRCHFTSELRIYAPSGSVNGEVVLSSTRDMTKVVLNAGNKASTLTVSTSPDNKTWTQHSTLSVASSYKDLTIDNLPDGTKYVKLVNGSEQVRIKYIIVTYAADVSETPACSHANTIAIGTAKDATCTEAGITAGEKCADCGETITAQETIPATGHTYEDHKCACGASEPKATFFVNGVEYSTVYGETVTLPVCDVDVSSFNKYSYTFAGWAVEEITEGVAETTFNKAEENVKLTTDKSFYAVFTYGKAGGEVVSYKKVTSAPSDWSGTYLIVYENGNVIFNGARTTLDVANNTISVTISDGKIAGNSEINEAVFSIVKSGSNYTIMSYSGYYIGQTSNANGLKSSTSTTYANTLSINNDGTVNFVSGGAYLRFNSNASDMRFRYYKSSSYTGQKAINLYAKTIETGTVDYYTTVLEKTEHEHEHSYSAEVTNPTCTEGGYTTYTCDCGDTHTGNETSALGHNFGAGSIAEVPATCISTGTKAHKYCSVCEKYFNEAEEEVTYASLEIPVDSSAHDSSLEENGVCSDCGVFYFHTFTKKEFGANGTLSFDGVAWTLSGDGGYWGDSTKGHQFGSGDKPYQNMTLVLAGFKNVSKVVINTSGASDIVATLVVKIGETEIGEIELTSTATEYTFNTAEALSGAITLEYSQTSSKAIYIKSVNVYGEQGSICDHSDVSVVDTATCTEGGVKTTTCNNCGYATSEDSVALGHSATCGHSVANVGDVYYESIKDAIDNAESGTITLVDDVTYDGILAITNKNIVIDLNGNNLVADGIVTFGYGVQIVDSGETKGLIDVERDKLVFAPLKDEETGKETPATSTEIVPVWNGEGYVIADVTDQYKTVASDAEDKFIIDFKPKFDGVAHSYVKGGETVTGLTFEVRITGGDFDKTYTVTDDIIAQAYAGKSVRLNLINAKEGVTYTVQIIINSECGLHYVGELGQYTYTVPTDAE